VGGSFSSLKSMSAIVGAKYFIRMHSWYTRQGIFNRRQKANTDLVNKFCTLYIIQLLYKPRAYHKYENISFTYSNRPEVLRLAALYSW